MLMSIAHGYLNNNAFSCFLKESNVRMESGEHIDIGRLFQAVGPATARLRSPYFVQVRRTTSILDEAELRCEWTVHLAVRWNISLRYDGGSWR